MLQAQKRGLFLSVEGTEGVGKSTNINLIENFLRDRSIDLVVTREPGGTPLAEELREILLANRDEAFDPTAELLTVFAARAQHLNTVIEPALAAGRWVLCDRFTDATFAYQGAGRRLSQEVIAQLEKLVQGDRQPDKTFLLDIDVELGLQRARARAELDRFEQEQLAFFERVRDCYQQRAVADPQRFVVIDAGQTLESVQADLLAELERLLERVL
ncbi:dTMP kinase [Teredinibacter waterburyi]|jgi:thymidylate kinase (EC 2.7.4.9)|uniref:dTMP kinase n=1 Tax=Teredinibacter waterburyi TaxID=1500538 RepID=UPI00165FF821|nr:dTMP kinase [Teredinibacter waterburyi]